MLSVVELLDDGGLHRPALEEMDFDRLKWLDVANPADEELKRVCEVCKLPLHEIQGFLDHDELPRVNTIGGFLVVIFKTPLARAARAHVSTTSMTFLLSEHLLISLHRYDIAGLSEVAGLSDERLSTIFSQGASHLLVEMLERHILSFFSVLDRIEDRIDRVEDEVFSTPGTVTVKKIFALKRTLIYFHKALSADRDVLVTLQKQHPQLQGVQQRFMQLYYDVVQLIDVVATYRDILTGSLDIYLSTVSNNMNAVMKKMTAYGSLVLVPTFITGLYGMNFRVLPETQWQYGYAFAWGIIIISVALLWRYFSKKDWF